MNQVSPGMNAAAASRQRFERYPLRQGGAHCVVNPPNSLPGETTSDDVLDLRVERAEDFNFQTAAGLPGPTLDPKNIPVNVSKRIPPTAIGKDVPAETRFGLR